MKMDSRPRVSVIVPVYKVEKFLRGCIDSILNQTYKEIQLILVDDGSPDNCGAICDAYARQDARIHVIHKQNGGVSSARNAGLAYVTGEYLTFCDSDDRYLPTWVEDLVSAMEKNKADVVVGNYVKVLENGMYETENSHEAGLIDVSAPHEKLDYCIKYVLGIKHGWEICKRLFRSDIVKAQQIRFCESCQNYAEDLGFVLEYSLYVNTVAAIESVGYLYTMRSGSMMNMSQNSVKLNSLNEVSLQFADRFQRVFDERLLGRYLPIMHYSIMNTEYMKMVFVVADCNMDECLMGIQRIARWRKYTLQLFGCSRELKDIFGNHVARSAFVLSYCFLMKDRRMFAFWSARMRNSK